MPAPGNLDGRLLKRGRPFFFACEMESSSTRRQDGGMLICDRALPYPGFECQRISLSRKRQDETHSETPSSRSHRLRNRLHRTRACQSAARLRSATTENHLLVERWPQKLVRCRRQTRYPNGSSNQWVRLRPGRYLGRRSARPLGRPGMSRGVLRRRGRTPPGTAAATGTYRQLLFEQRQTKLVRRRAQP
jgi:hypothetical protein